MVITDKESKEKGRREKNVKEVCEKLLQHFKDGHAVPHNCI